MAIDATTAASASNAATNAPAKKASGGIADNFDTFLSILTTQLKNQNPLDPLDTNQFTQQLVQFSGVEQQLKTNDFLEALLALSSSAQSTSAQATSLIGKQVTVKTAASELKDGTANWMFNAGGRSDAAAITIKDASGTAVFTSTQAIVAGENRFVWDGKLADGSTAPNGSYSIAIAANDINGKAISVTTEMVGKVDGVDFSGAEPFLMVGAARISLGSLLSVRAI